MPKQARACKAEGFAEDAKRQENK